MNSIAPQGLKKAKQVSLSDDEYETIWQASITEVAWGTVLLFFGVIIGYTITLSAAVNGVLPYPVATLICGYLAFVSFTVVHDAAHGSIFKTGSALKPLESLLGWVSCIPLLLVPYRFFQKIHDRHHAFTNDPERDPDYFGGAKSWYGIILNAMYIPFKYHWMSVTEFRHIKLFRDTYTSTLIYLSLIFGSMAWAVTAGYGIELLSFAVIPAAIAIIILALFFDFFPHTPHKALGRYHDTRIFIGKWFNVILLGQNYHLIHHMYPRLPWYKYQEVFFKIEPFLKSKGAPIEDSYSPHLPDFLKSPNADRFQLEGQFSNMKLEVSEIVHLTPSSVAISFKNPAGAPLSYCAGQYITIGKWINGSQESRCYSLCGNPDSGILTIGVKATDGGLMSNYLNRELSIGDTLQVQGPFGDFTFPNNETVQAEDFVLVAGGSGITPVLAIAKKALSSENIKTVHLIYANQSIQQVMFLSELEVMQNNHPNRFKVTHILGQPHNDWTGLTGYLNDEMLQDILMFDTQDWSKTVFYICGPEGLKTAVNETLKAQQISEDAIYIEQFVPAVTEPIGVQHKVEISLTDGQKHTLKVASNQTVLEVAKEEGIEIPHACGVGTCGSCKIKVDSGKVVTIPDSIPGLQRGDQENGYTLACQCHPMSPLKLSERNS